jgi:hypothetical protein
MKSKYIKNKVLLFHMFYLFVELKYSKPKLKNQKPIAVDILSRPFAQIFAIYESNLRKC